MANGECVFRFLQSALQGTDCGCIMTFSAILNVIDCICREFITLNRAMGKLEYLTDSIPSL